MDDTTNYCHPWQLWKQLVNKRPTKKRYETYQSLLQLFQVTPKLSWSRYFEMDPTAESLIRHGLYSQDLWLCSASLEYFKQLFEYISKVNRQQEPSLFRTCIQVAKVLITLHWERMELLVLKARHWRFEQRGFAYQVAALWGAIFRMDEKMLVPQWMSKIMSLHSPMLTQLAKSGRDEDYLHKLIFLWKVWNQLANGKELEYLYGVESIFVRKVLQHVAHCKDRNCILQVLKTLQYQNGQRWKHARVRMIRKGQSLSFIQTVAQWSVGDNCDDHEIQRIAKEWTYAYIGRVDYWVETEQLVEMAIQLPFSQPSHVLLMEQLLKWRPLIAHQYLLRCPFHHMDPEPTSTWIYQALALIKALDTDKVVNNQSPKLLTTEAESAKTYFEYCMHIWPLESKDSSCLERILLHTTHILCPWIGFQILLHILNRIQQYLKKKEDEYEWRKDIEMEISSRLPEFQVVWAVVRRELKQPSCISMSSIKWMEQLHSFRSMFYFVPMEPQHMNMELLTLGLQVIASYRKLVPWLEREQRWDISKIFFVSPMISTTDTNHSYHNTCSIGSLEYHWIAPLLRYDHLLNAVLSNIHTSRENDNGDSFRALIASQQGPRHFSRIGQLVYLYALYMKRKENDGLATRNDIDCLGYQLYGCIFDIWNRSGCFNRLELHFWMYWLSFSIEETNEENNNMDKFILQEHRIAWFEQLWIELWRKPFLIWDKKRDKEEEEQGTRKRKRNSILSCSSHLITLAIVRKLCNPKENEQQQVRQWFMIGVGYYIRLECFLYAKKDKEIRKRMKWWRQYLEQLYSNNNSNEEILKSLIEDMDKREHSDEQPPPLLSNHLPQKSLGTRPMLCEMDWKELQRDAISEEWKQSFLHQISPTPSHRLVILHTLLCQWNILDKSCCNQNVVAFSFHNNPIASHVLQCVYEILERISLESFHDYVEILWSHRIWKEWLQQSFDFFVQFTEYWTCAMKKKIEKSQLSLEKFMPILLYWMEKHCSDKSLVQSWLGLLSVDQLVLWLERISSKLDKIRTNPHNNSQKRISNIVDKCIVLLEELDSRMLLEQYPLSETLKQVIQLGWNGICQRDGRCDTWKKEWERLWSSLITCRRWLSIHIWLGIVMQKHYSSLMYLILELHSLKDDQQKKWRRQWIDGMWRRYPKLVGKWLRWIHHRKKHLKNDQYISIAYNLLVWKESSSLLCPNWKRRWISSALELLYSSLWNNGNQLRLDEYSKEWIQMAITSCHSSKTRRWIRIAWRWIKFLFRQESISNHVLLFFVGLDTVNVLVLDKKKEESMLDMLIWLLDWSERIMDYLDNKEEEEEDRWMLFSKYLDTLWKVFSVCIGNNRPPICHYPFYISYDNKRLFIHLSSHVSSEKCLQWMQSLFRCLSTFQYLTCTRICYLITMVKHVLVWFLDSQNRKPNEREWSEFEEWIQNWIHWSMKYLWDWKEVKTNLLAIVQLLLAMMLLYKSKKVEGILQYDDATFLVGSNCMDNEILQILSQQMQTESGTVDWLIKGDVQHGMMTMLVVIVHLMEEYSTVEFPWLKQSCVSVLQRLDPQKVQHTIEYILSKRCDRQAMMIENTWSLLSEEKDTMSVVYYLIQNSMSCCSTWEEEKYPLNHDMEPDNAIIDPVLLLSLIFQVFRQQIDNDDISSVMMIDRIQLLTTKHLMTFCMACLSVENDKIRSFTRACLERFLEMLSGTTSKYYAQAQSMTVFLTLLKNSITESLPVDGYFIWFCIQLWEIFCQPTHVLYMPLVKSCLEDTKFALNSKFFRLASKYVQEERATSAREESLQVAIKYREWCLWLMKRMERRQDFEWIRHIEIMEDCWRLCFGYSQTRKKEAFCKLGLDMLHNIVHRGEPEMIVEMDQCWGIISAIHLLWKRYPEWWYPLMNIYLTLMEKCDMETCKTPWLLGIELWKSVTSQWEENSISDESGKHILLRCLDIFKKCKWNIFSCLTSEWEKVWLPKLNKEPFLQWEYTRWLFGTKKTTIWSKLHWKYISMETKIGETNDDDDDEIWLQYDKVTLG